MPQRSTLALLVIVTVLVAAVQVRRAYSVAHAQSTRATEAAYPVDRTMLPIREPSYPESTVLDVRQATRPPRFEVKAPAGAPNVLIALIDDMGFGQSSAFGDGDSPLIQT